jgi:hypothetical protein
MLIKAIFTAAVSLVIAGVAGVTSGAIAVPHIFSAESSVAVNDLANIRQVQQLSVANDGFYAPSLRSLTDDEFGQSVQPRKGSEVSYLTNEARTHYVAATRLPTGQVIVSSDEKSGWTTCDSYGATCLAHVSSDASLVDASPSWVSF